MSTPASDLTEDCFLGGRLTISQPRRGYRAGSDPVLLAAALTARQGQSVLELGCGVGTALLCVGTRVRGLSLWGVELQPAMAALARRNASDNGLAAAIFDGDIAAMPRTVRMRRFDHVIANPPYYDRRAGSSSPHPARETAVGEALPLTEWVRRGAKRLEPRGCLTVIQKADRLPELVTAMTGLLGSVRIRPIQPRPDEPASLVIVQGLKGGGAPACLDAPLVLHEAGDFTPKAQAILRGEAAFS